MRERYVQNAFREVQVKFLGPNGPSVGDGAEPGAEGGPRFGIGTIRGCRFSAADDGGDAAGSAVDRDDGSARSAIIRRNRSFEVLIVTRTEEVFPVS